MALDAIVHVRGLAGERSIPFADFHRLPDGAPERDSVLGRGDNGINLFYFVFEILAIALWGYNRWFVGGPTGQSWGRRALGIRLVSEETGQPIGATNSFVRDLAHLLDWIPCFIGYLWPLWDQKKQTFADKIIKTVVVR